MTPDACNWCRSRMDPASSKFCRNYMTPDACNCCRSKMDPASSKCYRNNMTQTLVIVVEVKWIWPVLNVVEII